MVYIYFFLIFFSTLLVFIFLCTVLRRTFFYFGLIREEKIQQYSLFSYEEKETFYWSNHIHFSWIFFTRPNHVVSNQIIVHYSTIFSPFSQFGTFSPFCLWLLPGAREKGDKFAERMTLMRMKVTTQYSADEHLIRGILFFFVFFFFAVGFLVLSIFFSFLPVDLFPQCWFGKGRRALLFWFYIDWNIFLFLKVVSFSQSAGKLIEDDVEANKQGKVNFLETLQKKYIRKTFLKNGQKRQKITLAKSKTCGCVEAQGAIISFLCRWMSVCVVSELMSDVFTPQKLFWTELDLSKWMLFVAKN